MICFKYFVLLVVLLLFFCYVLSRKAYLEENNITTTKVQMLVMDSDALLSPLANIREENCLTKCVNKIIEKFISTDITTINYSFSKFQHESGDRDGQQLTVNMGDGLYAVTINEVQQKNYLNYLSAFKQPIGFVVVIKSLDQLNQTLVNLDIEHGGNNRFLIICQFSIKKVQKIVLNTITSYLNKNKINVQLVVPHPSNITLYVIYSWKQTCGKFRQTVVTHCSFGIFHNSTKLTKNKYFNKCVVKLGYINQSPYQNILKGGHGGFEGKLLEVVASTSHLTMNYIAVEQAGQVYKNGTITGSMAVLDNGSIDVVFGSTQMNVERAKHFQMTVKHMENDIMFCAPYKPLYNYVENWTRVLNLQYLIYITVTYLVMSCVIWYISNLEETESTTYKQFISSFFRTFSTIIGVPVTILPRTRKIRSLMALLITATIILNTFNTSYLTSLLSSMKYNLKYNNIQEVLKDNLTMYSSQGLKNYFEDLSTSQHNLVAKEISKNLHVCESEEVCVKQVAENNSVILLTRLYRKHYFNIVEKHCKLLLHCPQESLFKLSVALYVKKGFTYFNEINKVINRMLYSGLIIKLKKDTIDIHEPNSPTISKVIKIEHLMLVFKIYLVLNALAFVVFVVEVAIGKIKRNGN